LNTCACSSKAAVFRFLSSNIFNSMNVIIVLTNKKSMGLVKILSRPLKMFIAESAGWDHPERTEVGTRVDVSKQSQSSGDPKGRHLFLYIRHKSAFHIQLCADFYFHPLSYLSTILFHFPRDTLAPRNLSR
jgi:hypothetical protein